MKWPEIREHYPNQWLLVEAIQARSEAKERVLEDIAVVETFPDSVAAMKNYTALHHTAPERELYVLHTSRVTPDIAERQWYGIRGAA